MTLLPFLAVALLTGLVALAGTRRPRRPAIAATVIGLMAAAVLGLGLPPGPAATGGVALVVDGYARSIAVVGSLAGLLATLLAAIVDRQRRTADRPGFPVTAVALSASVTVGAGVLALSLAPAAAMLPSVLVGAAGLLGLLVLGRDPAELGAGRAALRAVSLAGVLAAAAAALIAGLGGSLTSEPLIAGGATLLLAGGIGLRVGAIPFHASVARIVPRTGLVGPFVLVWGAIPLAVAGAGVLRAGGPGTGALAAGPIATGIVAAIAIVTLIVAPIVAAVTDDLDHAVAYSVVQDMGLVVLAFVATPPAWEPLRSWLLMAATSKTALVAWSVTMRETFATSRLNDLHGWAIRAPLLAGALALIAVATVGVPTFAVAGVRRDLADAAFAEPLASATFLLGLLAIVPYLRLAAVGLSTPGALVRRAPDERFRRPAAWAERARAAAAVRAAAAARARAAGSEMGRDGGRGMGQGLADSLRRDPAAERAAARVADIAREFAIGANRGNAPPAVRGRTGDGSPADAAGPRGGRRTGDPEPFPVRRRRERPRPGAQIRQWVNDLADAWAANLVPLAAGLVVTLAGLGFLLGAGLLGIRGAAAESAPNASSSPTPAASASASPTATP